MKANSNGHDAAPATVLCMKWGAKYGPEYVNRLYAMTARHLKRPFRFLCLTDDPAGLRGEVETRPIPHLPPVDQPKERGWPKIAVYSPEIAEWLGERVLFLDLDLLVMGPLDPLFDHPGRFPMIRDWYQRPRRVGNSSVFRFRPAEEIGVFEAFAADSRAISRRFRNEQEFVSAQIDAQGGLTFWPARWCQSFRVSCLAPWPVRFVTPPKRPKDCRVLVFHGEPKPPDALVGYPALFQACRPAPWIAEDWRE